MSASTPLAPDTIHCDVSLRELNTFGLEAQAARYFRATSVEALRDCIRAERPALVLGGGSNLLITRDIDGLVLHVDLRERLVLAKAENTVTVRAGAGENWHDFVLWTIDQDFGGLENMSLIPGSVGASPIQNIGAYGRELKDRFVELEALNCETLALETFDAEACAFGYRDSSFKRQLRGRYIITSVTFELSRGAHVYDTSYGDIASTLDSSGREVSLRGVSDAVIAIRQRKLPDPARIGNSGSFFKNPVVSAEAFEVLRQRRPDIRYYELPDGSYKIPAGWLIDQAGWKGYRRGAIGVHDRQALVLVNHGGGRGADVWALAREIQADVHEKFGVHIEPEVNVI